MNDPTLLSKDALSMPIGEYIAELEADPEWTAELDAARAELKEWKQIFEKGAILP